MSNQRAALLGGLLIVAVAAGGPAAAAAPPAPVFAAFEAMSREEARTLWAKLTYVGPRDKIVPTVAFGASAHPVDVTPFRAHRTLDDPYYGSDDAGVVEAVTAGAEELQGIVRAVRHVLDRKPDAVPGPPFLSVALYAPVKGGELTYETLLTHQESQEFFIYLRGAVAENQAAQRTLQWWGCALDLLPKAIPAKDVSDRVQVTTSGASWNPATEHFECTATLTNTSSEFFLSPISLVVNTPNNWRLVTYHGTTCVTTPTGRQYLTVVTPGGGLWPQASVTARLEFDGPDNEPLEFTTWVLAGSGER